MGRAVRAAAEGAHDLRIAALVDASQHHVAGEPGWTADLTRAVERGDVVVDFSSADGARVAAAVCAAKGAALVSGSTGLREEDATLLQEAARKTAVLRASNFSLGVAALRVALRAALASVPFSWDVEIVERHHRLKKDSPSGTALTLAADVRAARSLPETALRHGRSGLIGPRSSSEIGMHAVRGGTWVGDHQVLLSGESEWIELRHVAQDRGAFAQGALAATRFLVDAAPGMYTLEDVLRGAAPPARG